MEADWDEVSRALLPPPAPNALNTVATAITFDNSQELLWTGNEFGRVTSLYGSELQKYTSYRGHPTSEGPVKQLLICDKGIISVSAKSVHLASRRGLTQWHLSDSDMVDLRCMCFVAKGTSEILVAGCQSQMFKIDVETGTIVDKLPAEAAYTLMKNGGQYICAAAADGNIHILEASTYKLVRSWKAHSAWINDMDVRYGLLVTCGWSARQQSGFMLDHLANVFDLKTLVPLPPVPFPPGAAFVRMHPRMSTTCIVASQTGLMYSIDIVNPDSPSMKHARVYDTHLLGLDLAPSGEALVLSDAQCWLHLWGAPSKVQFTDYSNPTLFADHVPAPSSMEWSPEIPLNLVGMPFYRDTLLSSWPSHLIAEVGAPAVKIDPSILVSAKRSDMGAFAPWPRKTRRYQYEDTRAIQRAQDILAAPKFLSEKARDASNYDGTRANGERRISDALEILADLTLDGSSRRDVPMVYKNVEIKYSKFGVDDFDFEYFNKTKYSGLETHIANSYANSLLQLLRFIPVVRNLSLHHTATNCLLDNCLICEMGFLTDMLEKAAGMNCQASNFLKAYSSLPDAATLGLLEEHLHNTPLTAMIQAANRYLLRLFTDSFRRLPPTLGPTEHAITTAAMMAIRCSHCANEMLKPGATPVHDLVYPSKSVKHHPRAPRPSFSQILKQSVERQEQTRGWCDRCKRYQQMSTRKTIQAIPKVLMINAAIHSLDHRQLWATPNWLPREIGVIVTNGQFFCYEGQDLKLHLQRGVYEITVYELVGLVADIHGGDNQSSHLVSLVNVSPSNPSPDDNQSWHLFNDFLVRQISPEEALRFDATWKMPSVLAYQVKASSKIIDDSWKELLDPTQLYQLPRGPHQHPDPSLLRPLAAGSETPIPMMPVAIDAEFVALSKAEIDVRADGTRETIRPPRLGLARVSVLRGSGTDTSLPFIDDYITMNEPVVDYLTAYSGISPGDLDRSTSRHNLISLKVAYKKLWLLLNLGVVFVGHGLAKDFRTINIHVPKSQVVDTVDLFSLGIRSQRRLSLRFLAWFLLKEDIQEGEAGHDSVEDARTALKLWLKWKELEEVGSVEQTMEDIWDKGREMGFKVPGQWKKEQDRLDADRPLTPGGFGSAPGTPNKRVVGLVSAAARLGAGSPLR
ncbi:cysteine proteinase [Myriangium duriaei CBS 260.36]|uniref:PAN2-PAN3 deadenylation complex catalytic subunit PAN2 n=1 Tax=Myriangium duriaei CBS 260.36 TaxID=1168546 RepID=A0A9P4MDN7_9PEZI|nr:cysteine proteinase [Myriangium duriaei CBS 260.36]